MSFRLLQVVVQVGTQFCSTCTRLYDFATLKLVCRGSNNNDTGSKKQKSDQSLNIPTNFLTALLIGAFSAIGQPDKMQTFIHPFIIILFINYYLYLSDFITLDSVSNTSLITVPYDLEFMRNYLKPEQLTGE